MLIRAGDLIVGNKKSVVVEHNGESLEFITVNLTVPDPRSKFDPVVGVLNVYWATLKSEVQDAIFTLYKEAHEIMEYAGEHISMHNQLAKVSVKLCNLHNYDDVLQYILRTRPIKIPDDLKSQYDSLSPDNSRTYLLMPYLQLVAYTVVIKCMLPIWGEYIQIIVGTVGSEFKEERAAALIKGAKILSTPPAERLSGYVHAYAEADEVDLPAVLGNMSSANFPDYLTTLTLVRRLATCRLPGNAACPEEPVTHLIRDIYGFLKSKVNNSNTMFTKNTVSDKSPEGGRSGSEEDNTSKLELVKLREKVDKGAIERYRQDALDIENIYLRLDHTAPLELLHLCRAELSNKLNMAGDDFRIWLVRRVICGYRVMRPNPTLVADLLQFDLARPFGEDGAIKSKIFGPTVTDYLELPERLGLMAVTQALLFHWGYPDLAALISSNRTLQPMGSFMGVTVAAISGNLIEQAFETYPNLGLDPASRAEYEKMAIESVKSQKAASQFYRIRATKNPLLSNVNEYVSDLTLYTWSISVPQSLRARINFRRQENKWVVPINIKDQLVQLVLSSKRG